MEPGLRTPLLDFFRRGEVARDVRLLAAQGALAPRAHEQLGLLVLLTSDPDVEVADAAQATLAAIPAASLRAFLARTDVPSEMRAFFSARGIEPAAVAAADVDAPMVENDAPAAHVAGPEAGAGPEADVPALQRIAAMTVGQRLALAMKGTREERAILIRDPNKIVAVAVLSSPKLSESEVESIAKMANVSDEVLRIIAHNRAWVKSYAIALALVKNPKTPLALSMNLLSRLNDKDVRMISVDRNVPEVLRITARKKVVIDKR